MILRFNATFSVIAVILVAGCSQAPVSTPVSPLLPSTGGSLATGGSGGKGGSGGGGAGGSGGSTAGSAASGSGGAGGSAYEEFPGYNCGTSTVGKTPGGAAGSGSAGSGSAGSASAGSGGSGSSNGGTGGGNSSGGTGGRGGSGASGGSGAGGSGGNGAGGKSGAGGASAGAAGAGATGTGRPATYSEVHEMLTCLSCSSSFCHGNVAMFNISGLGRTEFYQSLVGPDGKGGPAGTMTAGGMCEGQKRVVPGDPEHSLLFLKVALRPPCGDGMPPAGTPRMENGVFTDAQLEVIRSWIANGAKQDGP